MTIQLMVDKDQPSKEAEILCKKSLFVKIVMIRYVKPMNSLVVFLPKKYA